MAGGPKGQRFLRPAGCFLLGVLTLGWVCHTARAQDLPCAASIPMPPVLYVFGDSQFDVGNTNFIQADRANYFPYGKDFVPASGRFSNGRVIPDCIAMMMSIQSPPAFLSRPRQHRSGINFATGGAGILNATHEGKTIPLQMQADQFKSLVASGSISLTEAARGIYLINAGGNDMFFAPAKPAELLAYVRQMANGYLQFIKSLYVLGARKFVVLNVGALGCLPIARANKGQQPPLNCNQESNTGAQVFNKMLWLTLRSSRPFLQLLDAAKLVYFDQYAAGLNTLKNMKALGFTSMNACCGGPPPINGKVKCGTVEVVGRKVTRTTVCTSSRTYLFWDNIHPSDRVNGILARQLWEGGPYTQPAAGMQSLVC